MSEFDDKQSETTRGMRGGFWGLAGLSVAAFVFSVLGAKILSTMVEKGDFPIIAFVRSDQGMKRIANSAPVAQAPEIVTIVRSVGVDGVTTATIPHRAPAAPAPQLSPCGENAK